MGGGTFLERLLRTHVSLSFAHLVFGSLGWLDERLGLFRLLLGDAESFRVILTLQVENLREQVASGDGTLVLRRVRITRRVVVAAIIVIVIDVILLFVVFLATWPLDLLLLHFGLHLFAIGLKLKVFCLQRDQVFD